MTIHVEELIDSRVLTQNLDGWVATRTFQVYDDVHGNTVSPMEALAELGGSIYNAVPPLTAGSGTSIGDFYQEDSSSPQYILPVQQIDTTIISQNMVHIRVQYSTLGSPGIEINGSFEYSVGARQETDYFGYYEDTSQPPPPFPLVRNEQPLFPNAEKGVVYEKPQGQLSISRLIKNPDWEDYEAKVAHVNDMPHAIFGQGQLLLMGYDTQQISAETFIITFRFDVDYEEIHPHQRRWKAVWVEPDPPDVPHWEEEWTHVYLRADMAQILAGVMGVP